MPQPSGRYTAARSPGLAGGWTQQRLTEPSRLYGANGIRTGPDGRIYIAQVSGSQISAIDVETGAIEAISPMGGDIVGPDDLAFDSEGNLYATEITEGRVSVRAPNGTTRVLQGDMPVANPITFHEGRLIAGECRIGGRIMELDLNGGAPRMILDNVPMPNAFSVGPDGKLYTPVMGTNEIWRVSLEGGAPEKVAADLGVPVFVMSGPTTPDLRLNDPLAVDTVARAFPTLKIVCCHAFWPNIDGMLAVAFRNENVYVSPDMYIFAPGGSRSK